MFKIIKTIINENNLITIEELSTYTNQEINKAKEELAQIILKDFCFIFSKSNNASCDLKRKIIIDLVTNTTYLYRIEKSEG